jgi:hypothetical protein
LITAEVHRSEELLMRRTYHGSSLSLEMVLKQLEMYVVEEQLNDDDECHLNVFFAENSLP